MGINGPIMKLLYILNLQIRNSFHLLSSPSLAAYSLINSSPTSTICSLFRWFSSLHFLILSRISERQKKLKWRFQTNDNSKRMFLESTEIYVSALLGIVYLNFKGSILLFFWSTQSWSPRSWNSYLSRCKLCNHRHTSGIKGNSGLTVPVNIKLKALKSCLALLLENEQSLLDLGFSSCGQQIYPSGHPLLNP